jgi:hypothetical protein
LAANESKALDPMQTGTATAAPTHAAALAAQKKELEEMFEKQPIDALATQKIELETRFSIAALMLRARGIRFS